MESLWTRTYSDLALEIMSLFNPVTDSLFPDKTATNPLLALVSQFEVLFSNKQISWMGISLFWITSSFSLVIILHWLLERRWWVLVLTEAGVGGVVTRNDCDGSIWLQWSQWNREYEFFFWSNLKTHTNFSIWSFKVTNIKLINLQMYEMRRPMMTTTMV